MPATATIALILAAFAAPQGGTQDYRYFTLSSKQEEGRHSPEFARCLDRTEASDSRTSACLEREFDYQDAALNAAYKRTMRRLTSAPARQRLRTQQRAWLKTRYDACEAVLAAEIGDGPTGTLDRVMSQFCSLSEVIRRTAWLEQYR